MNNYITINEHDISIDAKGTIRALDEVSDTYTTNYILPASVIARAKRIDALVRGGTHYLASGILFKKR